MRGTAIALVCLALMAVSSAPGDGGGKVEGPTYRSPNQIRLSRDGRLAYVVNQTADSVSVLDVRARKVVREIPVGANPTDAALSPDGTTLFVTCRHDASVAVLDLAKGRVARTMPTGGYEPYGLALSPDGGRLYVANSLSNSLSVIDVRSGETLRTVEVGRSPRYVTVTPDGLRLVVGSSLSRNVSIVDLATGRVVETRDLGRASLVRQIACSPDGRWAFAAHVLSHDEVITLQMERGWIHSNGFSVLDLRRPGRYVTLLLDRLLDGAANPWGVALSPDGTRLYVSLAGVHEVAIVDLARALALAAEAVDEEQVVALSRNVEILEKRGIARRFATGGDGPRGLALSAATGELLVANHFSDNVSVLDPASGELRAVIELGPPQELTPWRKGEMLANDANLCFQRWFSCASCHEEDAAVDGLNWDLANDGLGNPKSAKSLRDVHDTPPAMWGGVRKDMDAAVAAGQRFLGSIPDPENHRALMAFFGAPRRPPNPYQGRDPEAARRGERIFAVARCDACHPPPTFTDGRRHDLGLASPTDLRSRFVTPSLRECYRTGPYLHDGRARTLREVFVDHNPKDHHGLVSGLKPTQLDDLVEYVRTLR